MPAMRTWITNPLQGCPGYGLRATRPHLQHMPLFTTFSVAHETVPSPSGTTAQRPKALLCMQCHMETKESRHSPNGFCTALGCRDELQAGRPTPKL
eukprot:1161333-Pelagomonas_calceolata.AAC.3